MRFKIVDATSGAEGVAGLDDVGLDHSVFTSGRITWCGHASSLDVGEGMHGTFGAGKSAEHYRAIRLS